MDSNIGTFFHYCPDTVISSLSSSLSGIPPESPTRNGAFDLTPSGIMAYPKRTGSDDWEDETDEREEEDEDWEDEDFDDEDDFEDDDEFDYEDDDEEDYWDDEEDIDLDDDDDI